VGWFLNGRTSPCAGSSASSSSARSIRRRSFSGSLLRSLCALFEKISFQVTLDLLERHELPSGDFRPPPLDGLDLLRGSFFPGKLPGAEVPPRRVLDGLLLRKKFLTLLL
jgi:hypothetical protein